MGVNLYHYNFEYVTHKYLNGWDRVFYKLTLNPYTHKPDLTGEELMKWLLSSRQFVGCYYLINYIFDSPVQIELRSFSYEKALETFGLGKPIRIHPDIWCEFQRMGIEFPNVCCETGQGIPPIPESEATSCDS